MSALPHACPGCGALGVPQQQLACKPCWFRLPHDLRNAVNGTYRAKSSARLPNTRSAAVVAHRQALAAAMTWYRDNRKTPP
jgi:hypothetical protein